MSSLAKRIIFGLIMVAFGIGMLVLRNTFILCPVVALICVIATHELNTAVKLKNKPVMALSLVASAVVPFFYEYESLILSFANLKAEYLVCLYVVLLCIFMLFEYEQTKFSHIAVVLVGSLAVPFALTRFLYFRDIHIHFPKAGYGENHGLFLILFAMFCAWFTDAGAYFVGSFLGKHKLCPNISPKKTVEGAVGGVVVAVISTVILYAVFSKFVFMNSNSNYLAIVLMTIALSIVSMCGDLTASVIKRNFGIKDFGKLIPGHGGVIDRFDSMIFVLATFYAIFNIFGVVI